MYWDGFRLENLKTMLFTDEELEKCTARKGDLLVCEGGDIGRACIWNEDFDIRIQNHIHKLRPYSKVDVKYFYYIFYLYKSLGMIGGKGIGIQGLSSGALHKLIFPLPNYNEQQRIVAKLEIILPVVVKYEKQQISLDCLNSEIKPRLRKAILQEAIQGRLVEQCETNEPATVLLEQIKIEKKRLVKEGKLKKSALEDSVIFKGDDNKYYENLGKTIICIEEELPFEIPNTWEWVRFGSLINMRMGKTPPRGNVNYWSNGVMPWVSISDMTDYGTIKTTKEKISDYAVATAFGGKIVPAGTLLMSFKLTVGRTSILNIDALHNEAIISITPFVDNDNSLRDYLFHILPLIANYGESKDAIKGKTLNSTSLSNLLIPLPPLAEQRRISRAIVTAWNAL